MEGPLGNLQLRFLVARPRSGPALLLRIVAESSECIINCRLALANARDTQAPLLPGHLLWQSPVNYRVDQREDTGGKRILMCRDEVSNNADKGEVSYELFPVPFEHVTV
ncbi:putative vegetative incompatibility protein HET-E-1 [Rosellinia necatrix]|uniref:Putative vegetative incompatibility protein HET-E-1 n=1 Tax=Rosellinia necatrix TaxID=77044 RepID=A0A1S8ABH2_ROSNE|nr:putative vegetative incompatibility protein HET-E-1 [Rosellinia necatrix]